MTHACIGDGAGEPKWQVHVDDGRSSVLIDRGRFDSEAEAAACIERYRANWGPLYAEGGREMRIVQVCPVGPDGAWRFCGGRDAVIPARVRSQP